MPETPFSTLRNLSPRSQAALREAGVHTLEAAAALPDEHLLGIEGVGPSSVKRIRDWQAGLPEAASRAVVRVPGSPEPGAFDQHEFLAKMFGIHRALGIETDEAMRLAKVDLERFLEEVAGEPNQMEEHQIEKAVSLHEHGAREEREAVVRWLRRFSRTPPVPPGELATRIEAGEHAK